MTLSSFSALTSYRCRSLSEQGRQAAASKIHCPGDSKDVSGRSHWKVKLPSSEMGESAVEAGWW